MPTFQSPPKTPSNTRERALKAMGERIERERAERRENLSFLGIFAENLEERLNHMNARVAQLERQQKDTADLLHTLIAALQEK